MASLGYRLHHSRMSQCLQKPTAAPDKRQSAEKSIAIFCNLMGEVLLRVSVLRVTQIFGRAGLGLCWESGAIKSYLFHGWSRLELNFACCREVYLLVLHAAGKCTFLFSAIPVLSGSPHPHPYPHSFCPILLEYNT